MKKITMNILKYLYPHCLKLLYRLGFKTPEAIIPLLKIIRNEGVYVKGPMSWIDNHFNFYFQNGIFIGENNEIHGNKYESLIKGLDDNSKKVVNEIIKRIYILKKSIQTVFTNEEMFGIGNKNERIRVIKKRHSYKEYGRLSLNFYEDSVFYYNMGLNTFNNIVDLKGKDIIDCGAFIGDTALMFSKKISNFNKIYCFEPTYKNYNLLVKTIQKNNLTNKCIPVKKGVGDENTNIEITFSHESSSINNQGLVGVKESIEIVKLDDFIEQNNINPGLIKRDIEGYELESIIGAEKIIKKYKPILLVSIYHTGKDFFEIKPLLDSRNLGYKFKIVHNNPFDVFNETILIAS